MKLLRGALFVFSVLLSAQVMAQEQVVKYYDARGRQSEKAAAVFVEVIDIDADKNAVANRFRLNDSSRVKLTHYKAYHPDLAVNKAHGLYQEWFDNGQLKEEAYYLDNQKNGVQTQWFENGKVNVQRNFRDNLLIDTLRTFYENGALRRIEVYQDDGKLVKGTLFAEDGSEIKPFFPYEEYPRFKGGESALLGFIGRNVRYPEAAIKANASGTVMVAFTIGKNGKIQDAEVVKSVYPALDDEAVRVIQLLPRWTPGKQEGKPVAVKYHLPIKFNLN